MIAGDEGGVYVGGVYDGGEYDGGGDGVLAEHSGDPTISDVNPKLVSRTRTRNTHSTSLTSDTAAAQSTVDPLRRAQSAERSTL
jgi:hypothetical protein